MFGLGALALWADSEPVLPAYVMGMVLAGTVGKDHALVRRLRLGSVSKHVIRYALCAVTVVR